MNRETLSVQRILLLVAIVVLAIGGIVSSGAFGLNWNFLGTMARLPKPEKTGNGGTENVRVVSEESVVIDVVNKVSPSVVTVGIVQTASNN